MRLDSLPPLTRTPNRAAQTGFGARSTGSTRTANRYPGTACPPGEAVVRRIREPRAPRFMGDKTYDEFILCAPQRPEPVRAMAPAPLPPQPQITVSPVVQTQVSPQISPVFQQVQDSPGASQGASTTQVSPGGQRAEGGGSSGGAAELIELFRLQAEADRQRRAEEQAAARVRADAERARIAEENARAQAEIQRRNEESEAEYQRRLQDWQQQRGTPSSYEFTPVAQPSSAPLTDQPTQATPEPARSPFPAPLLLIGVAVAAGVYFLSERK